MRIHTAQEHENTLPQPGAIFQVCCEKAQNYTEFSSRFIKISISNFTFQTSKNIDMLTFTHRETALRS